MIYAFAQFKLDTRAVELRGPDGVIPLEPKCFELLKVLIEERDRAVSKADLLEAVWPGVFVTDASLSTAIKQLRAALGDDGARQAFIKTVRGVGFRFVAEAVNMSSAARPATADAAQAEIAPVDRKPTIAVRPFQLVGADPAEHAVAEAIPAEIIATLSRLGWINVIARGSSFRFGPAASDDDKMAARLGATYVVSGVVEFTGSSIALYVQVTDGKTGQVLWSNRRTGTQHDIYEMRAAAACDLSNALELGLSAFEAERLAVVPTENLDAWGHYHLGIRHMYRYNADDNLTAAYHFQNAVNLDPGFARAHAGLSYTEFQNAFQYFVTDTRRHIDQALRHAESAVSKGEGDPFCNLIQGRARWLAADAEGGLLWIDRALKINPNYALGYYNHATLSTVICDGEAAEESSAKALLLSPMDPQMQSMYGTRALAAVISGELELARLYADRALHAPNPHLYVFTISAIVFRASGDLARVADCFARIRARNPRFGMAEFMSHFNLRDPEMYSLVKNALSELGS